MLRKLKPEIFQGNLNRHKYFEGWYHKHVSADRSQAFSVIPGISLTGSKRQSFIQFIAGTTETTGLFPFPLDQFTWDRNRYVIHIGKNMFSTHGIHFNLEARGLSIQGDLRYSGITRIRSYRLFPGIMGICTWIPFIPCHHGIVSLDHGITGELTVNGSTHSFTGGRGYIEKDWGKSFPESWMWLQCNNFSEPGISVMFSLARTPWLGNHYNGFLAFLSIHGKVYRFTTHNLSRLEHVIHENDFVSVAITRGSHRLTIRAHAGESAVLKAPGESGMNRLIKESLSSTVEVTLSTRGGTVLFNDQGSRAGLEFIEDLFDYL